MPLITLRSAGFFPKRPVRVAPIVPLGKMVLRHGPVRLAETAGVYLGITLHDQEIDHISGLPGGGRLSAGTQEAAVRTAERDVLWTTSSVARPPHGKS